MILSFSLFLDLHLLGHLAAVEALGVDKTQPEHVVRVNKDLLCLFCGNLVHPSESKGVDLLHEEKRISFLAD